MLTQKPGQLLAYQPTADADLLAATLVAMANADGGTIILGVLPDGTLADEIWEEEAAGALQVAQERCRPPIITEWQPLELRTRTLTSLRVARSPNLHALDDGRILVRHGSENRPISGEELVQIMQSRTVGSFEEESVAGAHRNDLDDEVIEVYLRKRARQSGAFVGSLERLLFEIGATKRDGQPTVAGILLFGKRPQIFLPQSSVVFVRFASDKPRADDGGAGFSRRDEIEGPLARIIEQTYKIVRSEMVRTARINGLQREEELLYPRFAVREALVNAICHRDYRVKGRRIEIRMYSDRLEVISPGGLAGWMTLDNLVEEHYSRNPRIVGGLYQWGYIEELGLGIDRMIEEMLEHNRPRPTFEANPHSFTVKLYANDLGDPTGSAPGRNINERQLSALRYVREQGSITNGELQQICSDISAETLRRDLADLVRRGELLKVGSKKGTYYILK